MVRSRCEQCMNALVPMYAEPCVTCAEMPIDDDLFEMKVIHQLNPNTIKDDYETIEVRKSCMICAHIEKGGYHPTCKARIDIDLLTVPFRRSCDLFILNLNYR